MEQIKPGYYKHYKGNLYKVIGIARHSETQEEMVVYQSTSQRDGTSLWVRPLAMFLETVLVDGVVVERFKKTSVSGSITKEF